MRRRMLAYKKPSGVTPPDGLIAYFKFNNNVNDEYGTISATLTGGSYVSGTANEALELGSGDGLDFNTSTLIGDRSAFSISGMFKIKAGIIMANWDGGVDRTILVRNNPIQIYLYNGTSQVGGTFTHAPLLSSIFYHLVITYDGSTFKLYVDGVKSVTEKSITGPINVSASTFKLNKQNANYGSNEYDGLRFWGKALNQTEIDDLYADQDAGIE